MYTPLSAERACETRRTEAVRARQERTLQLARVRAESINTPWSRCNSHPSDKGSDCDLSNRYYALIANDAAYVHLR